MTSKIMKKGYLMKTIDAIIDELISIGRSYPESNRGWLSGKHENQLFAQKLINLENLQLGEFENKKITAVMFTIYDIYQHVNQSNLLIEKIHVCLCGGEDFKLYKEKSDVIQKRINEKNKLIGEADGHNVQLEFSMNDYREAAENFKLTENNPIALLSLVRPTFSLYPL